MVLLKIYLLFWFFATLGWIMEVVYCSIDDHKLSNRGFFIGPYCPIYGFGAVIMLSLSSFEEHPFITFFLALLLCSILEYITSYLMERLFRVRWWDYTNEKFNFHGRVCLKNAVAFGALGVLFTRYLNPWFMNGINSLSNQMIILISSIVFCITTIDIVISFKIMNGLKDIINKNIKDYSVGDATDKIKALFKKKIQTLSVFEKRLVNAYHFMEKNIRKVSHEPYMVLWIFIAIGLIIGIILVILRVGEYRVLIPITISFAIILAMLIMRIRRKHE